MAFALRASRIFTGADAALLPGVVVIEDGVIRAVGLAESPPGIETLDLGDATLLPGLVDAHTHVSIVPGDGNQIEQLRRPAERQLAEARRLVLRDLEAGVTTMRVMGQERDVDFLLQQEIESGATPGPRLVCAGVQMAKPESHGHALTGVRDEEEIARLAEANIAKGAGLLKLFATGGVSSIGTDPRDCPFTVREIRRAADIAHRHGIRLAAHAHGGEGARRAIEAGVDTIEHGAALDEPLIASIADRGVAVVATLSILYHPDGIEKGDAASDEIMDKLGRARTTAARTWRRLVRAGIPYAVGTDSMHGLLAFDLAKLVELGATPFEALQAATVRGAEVCGLAGRCGRLAPGFEADLLAVAGNPLCDISALEHPLLVVRAGRMAFRAAR